MNGIAAVAGARAAGLRGPDVTQNIALAGDRSVVVRAGDACCAGGRIAAGVGGQDGRPLVGEVEVARSWQGEDLTRIGDTVLKPKPNSNDSPRRPGCSGPVRLLGSVRVSVSDAARCSRRD